MDYKKIKNKQKKAIYTDAKLKLHREYQLAQL